MITPVYDGEILKVQHRPCYDIVIESTRLGLGKKDEPIRISYVISKEGKYIGDTKTAYRLVNKFGISIFESRISSGKVCNIGYNLSKRKWYGWSHRAISSFKSKKSAKRFALSVS